MVDDFPPQLSAILLAPDATSRDHAWEAFLATHSPLLLFAARSLDRDHDAAMDRYTFVLEHLHANDFHRLRAYEADGRTKFTTWLLVVARRLCLDHYRQRYGRSAAKGEDNPATRSRAARRLLADSVIGPVDPALLEDPTRPGAQMELESSQLEAHLGLALASLEPRDRLLLNLRFEDDLSAREIAKVVGLPTAFHVYRRLNSVLAALRAKLRKSGIERGDALGA